MARHFTKQEIEEIRRQLATYGVRDTEFPKTSELNLEDYVPIIQEGKNKIIPADVFHNKLENGPRGYSAYEIAVQEGYTGTKEEWLADPVNGIKGNGVKSVTVVGTASSEDSAVNTYRITLYDETYFDFEVRNGKGIKSVAIVGEYSSAMDATNTYRITMSDDSTFDFDVKNATGITSITSSESTADSGTSTYTIHLSDNTEKVITVKNGKGIASVVQTTTSTEDGGMNVVTITLSDGTTATFQVRNGKNSSGFFATTSDLSSAISSPAVGNYAFVSKAGDGTFPAYIYVCTTTGSWTATENEFTPEDPTDVLDVLNSSSTTAALSANQGKVLDGKITQLGQELVKTGNSLGRTFIELNYITLSDQYAAVATRARIFDVTGNNCALIYVENLIGKDIVISSRQYSTYGALYVFSNSYMNNGTSYGTDTFINGIADRVQVSVPEGAKWLFVNYDANYLPTISLTITEEQAKFEKEVEEYHEKNIVKLPLAVETGKYITVSSSQTLITTNEACKYVAADISVEKMSYLYIDGLRSQDPSLTMAYVIVDANGGVLASGTYSYMKIHKIVAIPSSATKIYLNVDSDYNDAYIGYFLSEKIFDYIENRAILKTNLLSPTTGYVSVTSNKVKVFENENNHYYRIPVSFLPNTTKIRITAETLASPYNLICVIGDRVGAALQYNSESGVSSYVDYEVSLPAGAYYIYINCINACTPVVKTELVDGELNGYIQDKSLNGGLFGKKCVCFGDSITWYDGQVYNWGKEEGQTAKGYESYMREVGMIVNNQGYSGANITVILSQIRATDVTGYDYVTITSGANDSRYQLPVGTLAESGSTFNENTFIGALQAGIEYVLTNNPSAKILLMTPIKGWIYYPNGYAGSAQSHVSGDGIVEKRYADAIKEVAAYYSFPVCDWYNEAGVNLLTRTWFMNDPDPDPEATLNPNDLYSLHPTTAGFKRMADILIPVLRNM